MVYLNNFLTKEKIYIVSVVLFWSAIPAFCWCYFSRQFSVFPDFIRPFIGHIVFFIAVLYFIKNKTSQLFLFCLFCCYSIFIFNVFYYFWKTRSFLSDSDIFSFYQSNFLETWEFFYIKILDVKLLFLIVVLVVLALFSFYVLRAFLKNLSKINFYGYKYLRPIFSVIGICLSFFLILQLPIKSQFVRVITEYKASISQIAKLNEDFNKNQASVEAYKLNKDSQGELFVLVIGESLNKDLMHIYNKKNEGEATSWVTNTPFLDSFLNSTNKIFFSNTYASFTSTPIAVSNALSTGNIESGKLFPDVITLPMILKKADVDSIWISGQAQFGFSDNFITSISSMFNKSFYFNGIDAMASKRFYDEDLLSTIKAEVQNINNKKTTLLVIHLMGNHFYFANRYPDSFKRYNFDDEIYIGKFGNYFSEKDRVEFSNYLTSVRYNDWILQQIHEIAEKSPFFPL